MRHILFAVLAAALAALLATGACVFGPRAAEPVRVPGRAATFSHALHLAEELALDCDSCHTRYETEAGAGMPGWDACSGCHPAPEGAPSDDPAAAPLLAGFVVDGAGPVWTSAARLALPTRFSHAWHEDARIACNACHGDLAASEAVTNEVRVTMDACTDCHARREVADGGCLGCHPGVDTAWAPPTHDASWQRAHGRVWRAGGALGTPARTADDCALCHDGDGGSGGAPPSCESCHAQVAPADHGAFFRNRGHGMLALADRRRCEACHEEDACLQCHLEQRPLSHGAAWGEPADRHCLSCHFETRQQQACAVCHLDGPVSHERAPSPPPSVPAHATATSCLTCHASFERPHHPYTGDGDYCRRCHQ